MESALTQRINESLDAFLFDDALFYADVLLSVYKEEKKDLAFPFETIANCFMRKGSFQQV